MNKYEIKNYIYILLFIVLPILTGYIASRRGRNPIVWGLLTLISCGICMIVVFILPKRLKYGTDLLKKRMDKDTLRHLQMEIDRGQMESIEQMRSISQMNDIFH
jgi:H+/Cl- antiporter ClcA